MVRRCVTNDREPKCQGKWHLEGILSGSLLGQLLQSPLKFCSGKPGQPVSSLDPRVWSSGPQPLP